jgi:hypothetical protein
MDSSENIPKSKSHYILSSFNGHEKLWMAYWVNFFAINSAVSNLAEIFVINESVTIQIIALIVSLAVLIWSTVSVWRCAFNVENHYWGYVARVMVIAGSVFWCYYSFSS